MKSIVLKGLAYGGGAIFAIIEPAFPHLFACTFAVLVDCFTAWSLSKRVAKKYPEKTSGKGKISSKKMQKVGWTLVRIYSIIVLAQIIEYTILEDTHLYLPNIVAGAITFSQFLSILENEASCNDARWARWLSKYLCDKVERHFDIDLNGDGKINGRNVSRRTIEKEKEKEKE